MGEVEVRSLEEPFQVLRENELATLTLPGVVISQAGAGSCWDTRWHSLPGGVYPRSHLDLLRHSPALSHPVGMEKTAEG